MKEMWDVLDQKGNKTGELMERGWLKPNQFHLIVHVWIINANKEYLISKRVSNKRWPNMWGCTVGSAIAGDDSLQTVLKETKEELGLKLNPSNGKLHKRYLNLVNEDQDCGEHIDVWVFHQDVNLKDITLNPEETVDVMWASKQTIDQLMQADMFIPKKDLYFYEEI